MGELEMNGEEEPVLDAKLSRAIEELKGLVCEHFPGTTFAVGSAPDEPESILLWATVDVDDPDEVSDLVLERMLEMQLDEHIPTYLVPIQTPERILASMEAQPRRGPGVAWIVPRSR